MVIDTECIRCSAPRPCSHRNMVKGVYFVSNKIYKNKVCLIPVVGWRGKVRHDVEGFLLFPHFADGDRIHIRIASFS